jgi:hypothetical protein
MSVGFFAAVFGALGSILGAYGLYGTIRTRTAVLRGGRRVSLLRSPSLYWINFAALCLLVVMSMGLIYLGLNGFV